jgi:hypothetical protein
MPTRLILAYTLLALMIAFLTAAAAVFIRKRRAANLAKWGRGKPY